MLANYQQPALDEGKKEALEEFVAKRRAEIRAGNLVRS
jgi:trimethylamine:corrinoid methyltransferase-like protein